MTPAVNLNLIKHYKKVVELMAEGDLVPFLGPGVSFLNRSPGACFLPGESLPYADELATSIADRVAYPWKEGRQNLLRVSWYGSRENPKVLNDHLHDLFNVVDLTKVHNFLADIPAKLDAKGYRDRRQLIITTNYDRTLEEAFERKPKPEPYDLLTYVANSTDKSEIGKLRYKAYGKDPEIINDPSFPLRIKENILDHTIILKMQGGVDRFPEKSSFAVSDEDYIDYLARQNTPDYRIPVLLKEKLLDSSFLFLGFGVSEWNLRVVLRSLGIRPGKKITHESWAIMDPVQVWDSKYWSQYEGVEFMQVPLNDYIAGLEKELDNLPRNGGMP